MYTPTATGAAAPKKITVPELRGRKAAQGQARISMITAYDFTMARLVEEGGAEMVLVGDSLGMVVQGQANTLPVTMDDMVYHCRAVARGLARAHLVGDLPFLSYQASPEKALESAGRLMKEGFCESVKLEGGAEYAPHVKLLVRAGIPVGSKDGSRPRRACPSAVWTGLRGFPAGLRRSWSGWRSPLERPASVHRAGAWPGRPSRKWCP